MWIASGDLCKPICQFVVWEENATGLLCYFKWKLLAACWAIFSSVGRLGMFRLHSFRPISWKSCCGACSLIVGKSRRVHFESGALTPGVIGARASVSHCNIRVSRYLLVLQLWLSHYAEAWWIFHTVPLVAWQCSECWRELWTSFVILSNSLFILKTCWSSLRVISVSSLQHVGK